MSRLFGSVVRALDFYPGRPGSNPTTGGNFFQLCFIPLLRLPCCKMGASPRFGFSSPKMASRHHKWWLLWRRGVLRPILPSIICLGRFHVACRYIFNLWQLGQGMDFYPGRPGTNRTIGGFFYFFFFSCALFLWHYDFHLVKVVSYEMFVLSLFVPISLLVPHEGCAAWVWYFLGIFTYISKYCSQNVCIFGSSRKHAYIILTPLNPTFILKNWGL